MTEQTLTAEQKRIASDFSSFINLGHPVALAVEAVRADALASAEKNTRERIAKIVAQVAEHNNDINKAAPYPDSFNMGRSQYLSAQSRYNTVRALFSDRPGQDTRRSWRSKEPLYIDLDAEKVEKFVLEAKKATALQYDAFIVKLCKKIGDCSRAVLEGNHVWGESFLTVSKGTSQPEEIWKTQQIANYSKLGTYYPQWPSRKVKSKK